MTSLSFERVDRLYSYAAAITVHLHHVEHHTFAKFAQSCRDLVQSLREVEDEDLHDLSRAAERFRFAFSSTPLPANDPALVQRLLQSLTSVLPRVRFSRPEISPKVQKLKDDLDLLLTDPQNPYRMVLEASLALAAKPDEHALVVRDSRLISQVTSYLGRSGLPLSHLKVFSPLFFRTGQASFDTVWLLGRIGWYPSFLLTAPRAPVINALSYDFLRNSPYVPRTFVGSSSDESRVRPSVFDSDLWPEVDWAAVERQATQRFNDSLAQGAHEITDARLHTLFGGFAVYLDPVNNQSVLTLESETTGVPRLARVHVDELVPGSLIVLRTEGGGDYVEPVANTILGSRAEKLRQAQLHWKSILRDHVANSSLFEIAIQLLDLGSTRADETNVRNWMSPANICTQQKQDFIAIANLVGLEESAESLWGMMNEIRRAHLRAGALIRRRLIKQIQNLSRAEIETAGRLDFTLPDAEGGKLSAFRIEARSPNPTKVPWNGLGRPFVVEV